MTAKPVSTLSSETVAFESMFSGVRPTFSSSADSAIAKQLACAAAISSSGLVPVPVSNLCAKSYGTFENVPLAAENVPLPALRPPFQFAVADLFMASLLVL